MGILTWINPLAYGRKRPTDYDTLLSRLATEITTAKQSLAEIRLRERRLGLFLNLYGVGIWAVWVGLCWLGAVPWGLVGLGRGEEGWLKGMEFGGVVGWPVFLYILNRALHTYYARQRTHEQAHLGKLLKKQHESLEEVKRASGWYKTQELLDRYDEGQASARTSARPGQPMKPNVNANVNVNVNGPNTPTPSSRRPVNASIAGRPNPAQPGIPVNPVSMSPQQLMLVNQAREQVRDGPGVLPVPQKKWYDHLADKLMGEDPSTSLQNKYALVCARCFRHNGLVGDKLEWETTKWYCRHCNFFNPAPKDRHSASGSDSIGVAPGPTSPVTPDTAVSVDMTTPKKIETSESSSVRQRSTRSKSSKGESSDKMDVDDESI